MDPRDTRQAPGIERLGRASRNGWGRRIAAATASNRHLLTNAGSMVGTSIATASLGVLYWLLAAREFTPTAVGIAGAAISAMTLIGFVCTLGLGTLLMGEVPRRDRAAQMPLIGAGLRIAGLAGLVGGLAAALIVPAIASELDPLSASLGGLVFFAVGAGLTALALVLDQALIGLLRGGLQLGRNVVFAVVKLLVLAAIAIAVSNAGAAWIYSSWTVGIAVSLVALLRFPAARRGARSRPDYASLGRMRGEAASHAAVNLGLETADLLMPVIVLVLLSAGENASFYIAWMITNILVMVPLSLSMVGYAIGSGDASGLAERFRFTLRISIGFGIVANLVLLVAGGWILGIFGDTYTDATNALHVMALGVFPLAIKVHYVAVQRVNRRLRTALPIVWAGTVLELAGGAIGALAGGLTSVAIGWVVGLCIEACVMGPTVLRSIRPGGAGPVPAQVVDWESEWRADFEAATLGRH